MSDKCETLLYLHGGAELYGSDRILLSLVNGVRGYGWHPIVLLPNDGPLAVELRQIGIEVLVMAFPVLRRQLFTPWGVISYATQLLMAVKRIIRMIKERNVALVHSNTLAVLPGLFAATLSNVPHVWHVHEIIKHPRVLNSLLAKIAYRYSTSVVGVSKSVTDHLISGCQQLSTKTTTIYNGIDPHTFPYSESRRPNDTLVFGTIGRFNRWKGQLYLCEVAERVFDRFPNSRCLLVGGVFNHNTVHLDEVVKFIESRGLQDRIEILDFQKDVSVVFQQYDVFILPSTDPDPLPTVILEAMCTGIPVVANKHGGASEMVVHGETGYLVEVGDKEKMTDAICDLLGNREKRGYLGRSGHRRALIDFSTEDFYKKFSELYATLV